MPTPHKDIRRSTTSAPVKLITLLAIVGLGASCVAQQRPYQFGLTGKGDVFRAVSRALAIQGKQIGEGNPDAGIIHTTWEDSGVLYGQIDGVNATIVRRITVVLGGSEQQHTVLVRMESRRCATGGFTIAGTAVTGRCETIDGIAPQHQDELDALGQQLQQTLGGNHAAGSPSAKAAATADSPPTVAPTPSPSPDPAPSATPAPSASAPEPGPAPTPAPSATAPEPGPAPTPAPSATAPEPAPAGDGTEPASSPPQPPEPDPRLGTVGESCRARSDCEVGLRCIKHECVDERQGESCEAAADCGQHLRCIDNVCTSPTAAGPAAATTNDFAFATSGGLSSSGAPAEGGGWTAFDWSDGEIHPYIGLGAAAGVFIGNGEGIFNLSIPVQGGLQIGMHDVSLEVAPNFPLGGRGEIFVEANVAYGLYIPLTEHLSYPLRLGVGTALINDVFAFQLRAEPIGLAYHYGHLRVDMYLPSARWFFNDGSVFTLQGGATVSYGF